MFKVPQLKNEDIKDYLRNSEERIEVKNTYDSMYNQNIKIPLYIGEDEIYTEERKNINPPHDHKKVVGSFSVCNKQHVKDAINNSLSVKTQWTETSWQERASIFLKAAELIAGPYRSKINAATMIGQSKTIFQAEIDAACELVDFLKLNIVYITIFIKNSL